MRRLACALALIGCAAGCFATVAPPQSPTGPPPFSDGEVFGILRAARQGELAISGLARGAAGSAAVREFARRMVTEHTAALEREQALADHLGIQVLTSRVSSELSEQADGFAAALRGRGGPAFDHAYLDFEAALQVRVLELLDDRLLPHARAPELSAELRAARASIALQYHAAQLRRVALAD